MSLQRRLALFFVIIVILPLSAAGYMVERVVVGEIAKRARLALEPALDANVLRYNDRVGALDDLVQAGVTHPKLVSLVEHHRRPAIDRFLTGALRHSPELDYLFVLDRQGRVIGRARTSAHFLRGVAVPATQKLISNRHGPGFVSTRLPMQVVGKGTIGRVVGGIWLDDSFLLTPQRDVGVSVLSGTRIIASTAGLTHSVTLEPRFGSGFTAEIQGGSRAKARRLSGTGMAFVASTPTSGLEDIARDVLVKMLGLLLLALIGTAACAYLLARFITRPLEELADGARAVSEGKFNHRIPVRSKGEVGQLATSFNEMTKQLDETVTELRSSRDQLRRAVRRVGQTMRSTHDMNKMLDTILDTAADAVGADAAALWMFTPTREELFPLIAHGMGSESLERVAVGSGVTGFVAERARALLLPGDDGAPRPAPGEPSFPTAIALPLYSQSRLMGVLCTYRRGEDRPFTRGDLETVSFLSEQGGVAIENVTLHEEAQRLSLTDGLTGLWNRRYFEMQFRQALATAARFRRPFSILMLDLDHFKQINDNYGHQRGDAALIEFAQRVNEVIREIDTFARYGGEEFICLLSETDLYGATITANKIRDVIRSQPMGTVGGEDLQITVSIGVASYPEHGDSFRSLVEAADEALYRAKEEGRDRVCQAQPHPRDPSGLRVAT